MNKNESQMMFELGLKTEDLDDVDISLDVLYEIYTDYKKDDDLMEKQAEYRARILNACKEVNSVKWRVKDPLHLIKKIIRKKKKSADNPKYANINVSNYRDIITDLIGLRAIFIFKAHWSLVDEYIFNNLNVCSDSIITIYHANDDDLTLFPKASLVKKHEGLTYNYKLEQKDSRYRSIHYILQEEKPTGCKMELQARSILDEAWGEIDHHVRYPDNEDDLELLRKMSILNGQISGCEEHASQSYNYFTALTLTKLEVRKLEDSKSETPVVLESETVVTDTIEDSANVEEYVQDAKNGDSYESYKELINNISISSFENKDRMERLNKVIKSIQPLRDFESSDKNQIQKYLKSNSTVHDAIKASKAMEQLVPSQSVMDTINRMSGSKDDDES
ncbi:hypothetical protein [Psychrobacter sp. GP33]|uniref:hypothetical protein n=1 Tax=Psychrobacter sp. GP33 TaxID=2758709 RepID=UPI0015FB1845|nr:hypothetical protein [Psychrobacter sp. GP33]